VSRLDGAERATAQPSAAGAHNYDVLILGLAQEVVKK
jgi:hypothetical protein